MNPEWLHIACGLAVPIAIYYFLSRYRQRDSEGFNSAYRVALTIVLLYVLWMFIPQVRAYADLVMRTNQKSRVTMAKLHKLSAADLEAEIIRSGRISPNAGLRCTGALRGWDYVCSYMPTPSQSKTRLEFGVTVDDKRWVKVSNVVPEGTTLTPPR